VLRECFKHIMLQSFCNITHLIFVFRTFRGPHHVKNLSNTRFEVSRAVLFRIEFLWDYDTVLLRV